MIIAGRWSDEVTGAGFAIGYVDVGQQGQDVGGPIYNMQGYQVGTFLGRVEGTSLAYDYVAANGVTGTGRGVLRADDVHLDVQVQEHLARHVGAAHAAQESLAARVATRLQQLSGGGMAFAVTNVRLDGCLFGPPSERDYRITFHDRGERERHPTPANRLRRPTPYGPAPCQSMYCLV